VGVLIGSPIELKKEGDLEGDEVLFPKRRIYNEGASKRKPLKVTTGIM